MSEPPAAPSITEIGKARARIDGPLKVTGTAQYASDHSFPNMLYAVPVGATIAKGKIKAIDTSRALHLPGVVIVLNLGALILIWGTPRSLDHALMEDEPRPPFDD